MPHGNSEGAARQPELWFSFEEARLKKFQDSVFNHVMVTVTPDSFWVNYSSSLRTVGTLNFFIHLWNTEILPATSKN